MKLRQPYFVFAILTTLFSCNSPNTESKVISSTSDSINSISDTVNYDKRRQSLKLAISDTIKKSKSYLFSNSSSNDIFLLTINPGLVKSSKAKLQIITADNKIIYTQSFDAFYFIRGIYQPDTFPTKGGQDVYDKYLEDYWNSLTQQQFETYFKKSVDNFFEAIYPVPSDKKKDYTKWEKDITDKDFLNEVLTDSTIKLIDILCFNCDEGGTTIGYSRKYNKVKTLWAHD